MHTRARRYVFHGAPNGESGDFVPAARVFNYFLRLTRARVAMVAMVLRLIGRVSYRVVNGRIRPSREQSITHLASYGPRNSFVRTCAIRYDLRRD